MKKSNLVLIIIIIIAGFAVADYYLNDLGSDVSVKDIKAPTITTTPVKTKPPVQTVYKIGDAVLGYKVASQIQTSQVFDKIDLSNVTNIKTYLNKLEKDAASEPIYIYEIHGPKGEGSLTYLNVKLQFIAQLDSTSEEINEDASFGSNSFFFNDKNYSNTAFLLTQINDNLFAFQYSKADSGTYDDVKSVISSLTSGSPLTTTTSSASSTTETVSTDTTSTETTSDTSANTTSTKTTSDTSTQTTESTTTP